MSTVQPQSKRAKAPGQPEDVRAAAGIQVIIATMVMTAGLAIIAAEAGVATFYLEHRSLQAWALTSLILAAALVIAGFIIGGIALSKISENGYYADWNIAKVSSTFNAQAIMCLTAAVLVAIGVAFGSTPRTDGADMAKILQQRVQRDERQLDVLRREVNQLKSQKFRELAPGTKSFRL